jgi:hypothetical protein
MDWLVVTSPENFERTRRLGFTVQGFKGRHRSKASRMAPCDTLLYYLIREGTFAATCRVTSTLFEEHTRHWTSPRHPDELYPWRVRIEADVVVSAQARPTARELAAQLQFVKRWPEAHWRLAFQGMLHALPAADGRLIRETLLACRKQGLEGHPG